MARFHRLAFLALLLALKVSADAPPARVLVAPFQSIEAAKELAEGLQRSLIAGLAREKGLQPVEIPSAVIGAEALIRLARGRRVDYVVTGEFQRFGRTLRVTGRVISAKDGTIVGGIKATGDVGEWFDLQDAAGRQAIRCLLATKDAPAAAVLGTKAGGPSRDALTIESAGPVAVARPKPRFAAWGAPGPPGGDAARQAYRRYNYGYPLYPYPYLFGPSLIRWGSYGWW